MKFNEPESMAEIHRIREKLAEEWKERSWDEVSKEIETHALNLAKELKLPVAASLISEKV
ncbi:MAG: hypothetical protein QME64_12485 [bacterium]|nr:hypothetical protein [bacterium]